jgi:hypothetical protein
MKRLMVVNLPAYWHRAGSVIWECWEHEAQPVVWERFVPVARMAALGEVVTWMVFGALVRPARLVAAGVWDLLA